jgi:hypothetical protein
VTDPHLHPSRTSLWRGVFFAMLVGAFVGYVLGYRVAMQRVDVLALSGATGEVKVDGRVVWNVKACKAGCRTEADVAIEKAIQIVRGR